MFVALGCDRLGACCLSVACLESSALPLDVDFGFHTLTAVVTTDRTACMQSRKHPVCLQWRHSIGDSPLEVQHCAVRWAAIGGSYEQKRNTNSNSGLDQ